MRLFIVIMYVDKVDKDKYVCFIVINFFLNYIINIYEFNFVLVKGVVYKGKEVSVRDGKE